MIDTYLLRRFPRIAIATALAAVCQNSVQADLVQAQADRPLKNIKTTGVPDIPERIKDRIQAYQHTRSATPGGWLGDSLLIRTRFSDTVQLHRVDAPLGARTQLTFGEEPVGTARVPHGPAPSGMVFSQDRGGTEAYQLYWHDLRTGSARLLTDGKSRNTRVVWNREGTEFAYTAIPANGASWDLHAQNRQGKTRILWQPGEVGWSVRAWAPGGGRVLMHKYISSVSSVLYELDLGTGQSRLLAPKQGTASVDDAAYAFGGQSIFFTADIEGEFTQMFQMDLNTGETESFIDAPSGDIEAMEISPDGSSLAFVVNIDGYGLLKLMDVRERRFVPLPDFPEGLVGSLTFSHDAKKLAFSLQTPTSPSDVYVLDLGSGLLEQWTRSELGPIDPDRLITPELIRYPTFDQREIPAFLYRPNTQGPLPVFIMIHGGPESQFRPRFNTDAQFLAGELELAVIAPNVRGSRGYGKTWLQLDDRELREDSVKDIGALLDWIQTRPDLDSERVVVYGGSYGGYMVLASMVHYSDRLAAGIEIVGISDFVTFLENTESYRKDLRRSEYGDERDPEMRAFLQSIAPLRHADRITRPMLIGQGLNDPRVPASESTQIVHALTAKGLPVWYVLAENEGHGFAKKANRDYWDQVVATFLVQQLNLVEDRSH